MLLIADSFYGLTVSGDYPHNTSIWKVNSSGTGNLEHTFCIPTWTAQDGNKCNGNTDNLHVDKNTGNLTWDSVHITDGDQSSRKIYDYDASAGVVNEIGNAWRTNYEDLILIPSVLGTSEGNIKVELGGQKVVRKKVKWGNRYWRKFCCN